MIHYDLMGGTAVIFILIIICLFCVWVFNMIGQRGKTGILSERIVQCPYCGQVVLDYSNKDLLVCSLCHSYLEAGVEARGQKK